MTRVMAILTAAAGLSALVAFTGAAIVWVRFEEAKLPAEQAVAVTPEPALITVGGAAIGAFALIAGLAVLIVYLVDTQGTRAKQSALVLLLAGTGVALATLFADASGDAHLIAMGVTAVATLAAIALAAIALDTPRREWVCKHQWHLLLGGDAAVVAAVLFLVVVLDERLAAGALLVVAAVLTALLVVAFTSDDGDGAKKERNLLGSLFDSAGDVIRFLAAPAALALVALVLYLVLNAWWIAILVLLAATLVIGVLTVAHRTGSKFAWYGTAVFVAVVVFGATLHALRTVDVPRLQPMAILYTAEAGGGGQSGLFVSQTSDRVYLGVVERCHRNPRDLVLRPGAVKGGTGQIVSVPRSQIAAESVGTVGKLDEALARAPRLLNDLQSRFTPDAAPSPPPAHPCENEGVIDQKLRTTSEVPAATAEEIAARFRPILKFDSEERWRPLEIDLMLTEADAQGESVHRLCDGVKEDALHCSPITVPSQIAAAPNDPKAFVNLAGVAFGGEDHRTPALDGCPPQDRKLQDCDRGPASAIYYNVAAANGRYYVDYWWFLRYNRFEKHGASELCRSLLTRSSQCFDHEGDWEGVTVVASLGKPKQLAFVHYAAHEGVFRYTPEQIEHEGTRPVVYVARGSHAAYPAKCERACRQVAELFGHALPEDSADGGAEWGRNEDAECEAESSCLRPLPSSWREFAGFWGSRTCDDDEGSCRFGVPPRSPTVQRRFNSPWCYSGVGLRLLCDGELPPALADGREDQD